MGSKIRGKRLTSRLAGLDPNEQWKQFVSCMKEVVEETIPLARRTNKKRPWVNNNYGPKSQKSQNKAWKMMQKLKLINYGRSDECTARQLEQAKEKYIKKRNAAKEINRRAIREYECQNIKIKNIKRDNKSFYRYMRSKAKTKRERE